MDLRPLSSLPSMQLYSTFSLACLAAVTFTLILIYRSCTINARLSTPQGMPVKLNQPPSSLVLLSRADSHKCSASVDQKTPEPSLSIERQTRQSLSKVSLYRPSPSCTSDKEQLALQHNLAVRHPPLIWIPISRLSPPSSTICGRKGSDVSIWAEDSSQDSVDLAKSQRYGPSDLLSGVGGQFTTSFGRRLSCLVWNDGDVDESDTTGVIAAEESRCALGRAS